MTANNSFVCLPKSRASLRVAKKISTLFPFYTASDILNGINDTVDHDLSSKRKEGDIRRYGMLRLGDGAGIGQALFAGAFGAVCCGSENPQGFSFFINWCCGLLGFYRFC